MANGANRPLVEIQGESQQKTSLKASSLWEPAPRSLLIDEVKGLAITLVALGHTNQGELTRGWWGASPVGPHLNAFIYSFHMPAFFFISGVLLVPSVNRRGSWGFTIQKLRTILYPFVLWSLLLPLAMIAMSPFVAVRPPEFRLSLLGIVTGNSAWFLPALFVALVLGMSLRHVPWFLLLPATCLAAFVWPGTHIAAIDQAILHLPFVVAGMYLGGLPSVLRRIPVRWSGVLAVALGSGLYFAVAHVTGDRGRHWGWLPAGFWGTGALLLLGRAMEGSRAGRIAATVGAASLAVFLISPFPQGAGRALLLAAHCKNPSLQLILPTLMAIGIPVWLYHRRRRLHLGWLFAWGSTGRQQGPVKTLEVIAETDATAARAPQKIFIRIVRYFFGSSRSMVASCEAFCRSTFRLL